MHFTTLKLQERNAHLDGKKIDKPTTKNTGGDLKSLMKLSKHGIDFIENEWEKR